MVNGEAFVKWFGLTLNWANNSSASTSPMPGFRHVIFMLLPNWLHVLTLVKTIYIIYIYIYSVMNNNFITE